jgi:hypothetical protein
MNEPTQVKCEHAYSRSMNQPYPRRCIKCGETEQSSHAVGQEWTAITVDDIARYGGYKAVADAHNAALADEKQDYNNLRRDFNDTVKQLAAKEELHAAALQVLERHHQRQLADEREKMRELERITSATGREAKLQQQLLAAQAAIAEHNKSPEVGDGLCYTITINLSALDTLQPTPIEFHGDQNLSKEG